MTQLSGVDQVPGQGFRRAALTVLVGSAAGFGINLALTPALARVYSPDVFGTFATVSAVAAVFIGVSTFRLEVFSQRVKDDLRARALLFWSLLSAVMWGVVVTIAAALVVGLTSLSPWWLCGGALVVAGSLPLVGSARLTREQNYRSLARSNFTQGAAVGVSQLAAGLLHPGVGSLLAGFVLARLTWLPALHRGRRVRGQRDQGERTSLRRTDLSPDVRRFAAVSGGSAFVNSCAGQLPILLCSWFFGSAEAGFLAMAYRIMIAPLGIVGQAAAAANIGEVGRLLRDGDPAAPKVVGKSMRDLLLLGLAPCVAAATLGGWAVPILLGQPWKEAGALVAALSMGALAQFVFAPFSQLLNLTGRSRGLLGWDTTRLLLAAAVFGLVAVSGGSLLVAAWIFSGVQVVLYLGLGRMVTLAVRRGTR